MLLTGSNLPLPDAGPDSSLSFPFKILEAIMGTMVRETNKEASSARHTVTASGRESLPAIPDVKTMGKNTAMVVNVEAVMAIPTSVAPAFAASSLSSPNSSKCRKVFSITTTALSTSIPIPRARPPSVIMLKVYPKA